MVFILNLPPTSGCEKTNLVFFHKNTKKIPLKPPYIFVFSGLKHKQGTARHRISFSSFDYRISRDNSVWFIDIFSGKIDLEKIGFSVESLQKEG